MSETLSTIIHQPSTLLIRADATRQIGNGHVMRCLALAAEWQARGGHVIFLSHLDNPAIAARIDCSGAERIALNARHPHPADLPEMLALLQTRRPAWTLLDGYHFTPCYQQAVHETMQKMDGKTLLLDDMAHRPCYHADLLLNQNVYASGVDYPATLAAALRLGSSYALLRPEFAQWRTWERTYPHAARNILVTLGGTDPDNVTLKVAQALSTWRTRSLNVKIVIGPGNPHLVRLQHALADSEHPMELLLAPENMAEQMAWADLAVSAAGTTALELAYMQVPTLSLVLADNQRRVAVGLASAGTLHNLGCQELLTPPSLANTLNHFVHHRSAREAMGRAGRSLVDGRGAERIVGEMLHAIGKQNARNPQEALRCA